MQELVQSINRRNREVN